MIAQIAALAGQALLFLILAPLLNGMVRRATLRFEGRAGPGLWQDYHDLWKWLNKEQLRSANSTAVGSVAPPLALAVTVVACLLIPTLAVQPPLPAGDLIVVVAALAVARGAIYLATLDAGGEGQGWAASLTEPLLLFMLVVVFIQAGSTAPAVEATIQSFPGPGYVLAFVAILLLISAEPGPGAQTGYPTGEWWDRSASYPHSVPAAFAGRDLAIIRWSTLVRQQLLLSILACLFLPWGLSGTSHISAGTLVFGGTLYVLKLAIVGLVLGVLRAVLARRRGGATMDLLALAFAIATLGLLSQAVLHA